MTFEEWKDGYGLVLEPNYSKETEADCLAAFNFGKRESAVLIERQAAQIESLRQQLEAALAACELKDEAMQEFIAALDGWTLDDLSELKREAVEKALTIQPDDSALKAWIGEPVGEVKKHTGSLKDMAIIVWTGKQPEEGTNLYSPKGLK